MSIYTSAVSQFGGNGEEEEDSHLKVTGMHVVSLRAVNCRFWSQLGCLGQEVTIFANSGIT